MLYYLGDPALPRVFIVSIAIYSDFVVNYDVSYFLEKVDTLNLESQNLDKNISQSSPIKIWGKSVKGFLSYERKNKQTDKQRLQLYML